MDETNTYKNKRSKKNTIKKIKLTIKFNKYNLINLIIFLVSPSFKTSDTGFVVTFSFVLQCAGLLDDAVFCFHYCESFSCLLSSF